MCLTGPCAVCDQCRCCVVGFQCLYYVCDIWLHISVVQLYIFGRSLVDMMHMVCVCMYLVWLCVMIHVLCGFVISP